MACVHYASIHLERDVYTALILLPVNIIRAVTKQWQTHTPPSLNFRPNWSPKGWTKNFVGEQASPYHLITGFEWCPPPPQPPSLIWMSYPPLPRGRGLEFSPVIKGMTPWLLIRTNRKIEPREIPGGSIIPSPTTNYCICNPESWNPSNSIDHLCCYESMNGLYRWCDNIPSSTKHSVLHV